MPSRVILTQADVGDDVPVTLQEAVRLWFPGGAITLSSLRTEARKGRLEVLRIAGKDCVTRQAIRDMMDRCRVVISAPPNPEQREEEDRIEARDALLMRLQMPNSRLAKRR